MGQPVDNLWITIGTTLACPMLARVLLVLQHSCQAQSWHGSCMGCNICANTRRAQGWHESCMRCNMRASVQVGMGFAWGKLGLTSVWAYVGPYSDKHNTRHNTSLDTRRGTCWPKESLTHKKIKNKGYKCKNLGIIALNNNENSSAKHCTNIQQQERHTWKQ